MCVPRSSRVRHVTIQMSSEAKQLRYEAADRIRFKAYFVPPKPKRGRPKKKKRKGRPRKRARNDKQQCMIVVISDSGSETEEAIIDLVGKDAESLDARLEGVVAKALRNKQQRINWDIEPNSSLRLRMADSWHNKNDLYNKGESFNKFCVRMAISRNVLQRFLLGNNCN